MALKNAMLCHPDVNNMSRNGRDGIHSVLQLLPALHPFIAPSSQRTDTLWLRTPLSRGQTGQPMNSASYRRVVLAVLDGLRPDAIDALPLTNLQALEAHGAWTHRAWTVSP